MNMLNATLTPTPQICPPVCFRYVSLSDNEKTGFKARELKSVHVDAVGRYLRLNIHKNHINKHNLYNQVLVSNND